MEIKNVMGLTFSKDMTTMAWNDDYNYIKVMDLSILKIIYLVKCSTRFVSLNYDGSLLGFSPNNALYIVNLENRKIILQHQIDIDRLIGVSDIVFISPRKIYVYDYNYKIFKLTIPTNNCDK
jgi:hypothetical protein